MTGYWFLAVAGLAVYLLLEAGVELGGGDAGEGGGGGGTGGELVYETAIYEDWLDYTTTVPWGEQMSEAEFREMYENLSETEKQGLLEEIR